MHSRFFLVLAFGMFGTVTPALAGSHMWRFNEVFSDASGTIQFIEFFCADVRRRSS